MFWTAQAQIQKDTGRVLGRSCSCGRPVSLHKRCPVSWHGGQDGSGGQVQLGGIFRVLRGGIKSLHHLVLTSAAPGTAVVRDSCNAEGKMLTLLKKDYQGWKPRPNKLLAVVQPPGLSLERRRYLYEKIRDFVRDPHKDVVCPPPLLLPATPTSASSLPLPATPTSASNLQRPATPTNLPLPHHISHCQPHSPTPSPKRRRRKT